MPVNIDEELKKAEFLIYRSSIVRLSLSSTAEVPWLTRSLKERLLRM